jgi:hypothetical protein
LQYDLGVGDENRLLIFTKNEVLCCTAALAPDVNAWNDFAGQLVKGKFGTGRVNIDQVIAPVNARRHPVRIDEVFRAHGPGMGLYYPAKRPCQTLAVLGTRYLNLREIYPYGHKEQMLAREIVDLWWRACTTSVEET